MRLKTFLKNSFLRSRSNQGSNSTMPGNFKSPRKSISRVFYLFSRRVSSRYYLLSSALAPSFFPSFFISFFPFLPSSDEKICIFAAECFSTPENIYAEDVITPGFIEIWSLPRYFHYSPAEIAVLDVWPAKNFFLFINARNT